MRLSKPLKAIKPYSFKEIKKDDIIQIVHNKHADHPQVAWFVASDFVDSWWEMKLLRGYPNHYWSSAYDLRDRKEHEKMEIIGTKNDYPEYFL